MRLYRNLFAFMFLCFALTWLQYRLFLAV